MLDARLVPQSGAPRRTLVWLILLLALCFGSVIQPLLGLPAVFFAFIGAVALPQQLPGSRPMKLGLVLAALLASVGVFRFVIEEAAPGIVQGGRAAVERKAVERLRELLIAEDALRRLGSIDADGDGVGSAALLAELCGAAPLRGGARLDPPALACRGLVPFGPALADDSGAYLHVLCLPAPGGGWTAALGAPVDEEQAERRFVAYAWPGPGSTFDRAFFIDEHERILETTLARDARNFRCDVALAAPDSERWQVWMGKVPRAELPGDPAGERPR
jgi:hypothetical protein